VIAAVEPKNKPSLYRAVISKLLENRSFIPTRPTHIRNRHPDLVPDLMAVSHNDPGDAVDAIQPASKRDERWKGFLSDVFVGWIGKWLNLPEVGFWHEDTPESISRTKKGEVVVKYKPSYGDKQREAQRRKQEEQTQDKEMPPASSEKQPIVQPKMDENRSRKERKRAS